jgi:cellulose synthase/poly-beta-1,6-N-acetylglucosamine synthase-like glycosyltransferase
MAETLFWGSMLFIFYAYFGYPMCLLLLSVFRNRPVQKGVITPSVSFIITAYNEEKRIREKIENTLALNYPKEKIEIIVASDCSSDGTDDIVCAYGSKGIRLVRAPERAGKEAAQKLAVEASAGEILVFSDVATILEPEGVANIIRNFADPSVGCVSSEDRFIDPDGKVSGEGAYVRYEMFLRTLESRVNTLVGLSGSFFAARKEVCREWAIDLQSDFNTLLNSVKRGLRGVSDPESIGYYRNIADERKEFERKTRTIVRGISVFMKSAFMLNVFRYGLFSWQLFSHKLCRWLVPFAMIAVFLSNSWLLSTPSKGYAFVFVLQIGFYVSAAGGWFQGVRVRDTFFKIPRFFVIVNLSILSAWVRYLKGERMVSWTPSER